jgi:ppGpp synthetase/RelA/SpoT-type nucleotidyltranferase/KaiC/GvpD/RAD55 family RecA-like ATPase
MTESKKKLSNKTLSAQVELYAQLYPRYQLYAETLSQVFEKAKKKYAPLAIVQARPKAISSFAEKILRKNIYMDPVSEMTDLCGARIVTHISEEVKQMCEFIEKNFAIDWDNSVDVSQRLKPTEFGYRSVHYIVQFKEGVFPNKEVPVDIPKELFELKAEIQVRTILEHSWADFSHDMSYKGAFKIPAKWERELAGLAASLESADHTFSRIHEGLRLYASNYGAYLSKQQIQDEVNLQQLVLENDPKNVDTAHRIGKLWLSVGEWQNAIDMLSKYVDSGYLPLLRDLGVALCKKHKDNKHSLEYLQGQKYLEAASAPPSQDVDALTSLAGTYKETDEAKVRDLHRQAFMIDPTNPYVLGNYLESEIVNRRDVSILTLMNPLIEAAIKRCFDQAEVGINVPWVYFDIGTFYLLLNKPYDSLEAYAKAIQMSLNEWVMETTLKTIDRLAIVQDQLTGYQWAKQLLLIGLAAKFPSTESGKAVLKQLNKQASAASKPIEEPVVVVAGGCDSKVEAKIQEYRGLILNAFQDFKGTIISGGTTAGVSGLVGESQQKYLRAIKTIGYVPKSVQPDIVDKRYGEIRYTSGGDSFSLLEPLQYWTDILVSDINPSCVKLVGVNGGKIAAVEYRMAIALGASVALVQGSELEASKLLSDNKWNTSKNLIPLANDSTTIWAFIQAGVQSLDSHIRETVAKAIHESYRAVQITKKNHDPSLMDWSELLDYLKQSNLQQADHIIEKLHRISCTVHLVKDREVSPVRFTKSEIEIMAEMEHARWSVERLLDGWKKGATKDVTKKITPYIVPWSELPDEIKEYDRDAVRKIPEILAKVSLEIRVAGRVSSGLPDLDRLLLGGIPRNYSVILGSPSCDERELLVKRFVEAGTKANEPTVYITCEATTARDMADQFGSNLHLVVCNSQADALIHGPNVYKLKGIENLTDIDIVLTKFFRTLDQSQSVPKRACIDLISDVLLQHHAVTTRKWLGSLLPNLKSKGFTTLAIIDPQMHPPEEVQAVIGLFDGEIKVSEKETVNGLEKVLKVRKLYNQKYLEDELVLSKEKLES